MNNSDSTQDSIRELARSIKDMVDRSERATEPPSYFERWANSPFVVTLIGGVIIALTTTAWTILEQRRADRADERASVAERLRVQSERTYDLMLSTMLSFANEFPGAKERLYVCRYHYLWLMANAESPDVIFEYSGQPYSEVWKEYRRMRAELVLKPIASSFPPQIRARFSSPRMMSLADDLGKEINILAETGDVEKLNKALVKMNGMYDSIIHAMEQEIRIHIDSSP